MAGSDVKAGGAYVELYATDDQLRQQLDAAAAQVKSWGKTIIQVGGGLLGAGAAITAPLIASAKAWATSGSEVQHMSDRTGVAVGALSELRYAAKLAGGDADGLEGAFRKMQKAIAGAAGGSGEAQQALAGLGLSAQSLLGMKGEDQLAAIAEAISKVGNPTLQAAAAMQIFGKTGTSMLPLLKDGAAGLAAWRKEAAGLGLSLSEEGAQGAERLQQSFERLEIVSGSVWKKLGAAVAPALSDQVDWLTRAQAALGRFLQSNSEWIQTAYSVGGALLIAGKAVAGLGTGVYAVGMGISGLSKLLGVAGSVVTGTLGLVRTGFSATLGAIQGILSFGMTAIQGLLGAVVGLASPWYLLGAAVLGVGAYLLYTSGAGKAATSTLATAFGNLWKTATEAWQGISDALAAGDLVLAARTAWAGIKVGWYQLLEDLGLSGFSLSRTLGDLMGNVVSGWRMIWADFENWFTKLTLRTTTRAGDAWSQLKADVGAITQEQAVAEMRRRAVGERAGQNIADDKLKDRLAEIEKQRDKDRRAMADEAARDKRQAAADLEEARVELEFARMEAEDARARVAKFGGAPRRDVEGDLAGLAGKVDVAGTFSGAGARGLMYGTNLQQRALAVAEQQLDEMKGLRKDVQDGGARFQ